MVLPFPGYLDPHPWGHTGYREFKTVLNERSNPDLENFSPLGSVPLDYAQEFGDYEYYSGNLITYWEAHDGRLYPERVVNGHGYSGSSTPERFVGLSGRLQQHLSLTTVCVHLPGHAIPHTDILHGLGVLEANDVQNAVSGLGLVPLNLVPIEIAIISDLPFSVSFPPGSIVESTSTNGYDSIYEGYPHLQGK